MNFVRPKHTLLLSLFWWLVKRTAHIISNKNSRSLLMAFSSKGSSKSQRFHYWNGHSRLQKWSPTSCFTCLVINYKHKSIGEGGSHHSIYICMIKKYNLNQRVPVGLRLKYWHNRATILTSWKLDFCLHTFCT